MQTYIANDLHNKSDKRINKQKKIFTLLVIIIPCFCIYVLKLFSMQVIDNTLYQNQSKKNMNRAALLPAQRGEIFDRSSDVRLVTNIDTFSIEMIPGEIPNGKYDTVASKLASLLSIPKSDIDKKVPPSIRRSYSSVEIHSNVNLSVMSDIAENSTDLPGVSWKLKPQRNYLSTGSFSHILGYVGNITKEELKILYNKGYSNTSIIGKTGIEKQYDSLLQGTPGWESKIVDVKGKLIRGTTSVQQPIMGKNLILTIDANIQILAEKALGNRVGAAVVLKPASGEILALVSYPYFDSNIFNAENASSVYAQLTTNPNNPLLNRAVNAEYPPASTFKIIMTTALLSENSFPSDSKIECSGRLQYGDRTFRCHIGIPGHGFLDLRNALAQSCNVYYWTVGRDNLGVDVISSYAKEFGFGQTAQIDLPNQSNGFVPTPQWKERRYHEKWLGGDTMNMSIGQSFTLVTPLQIANMMAMVVNSGKIYRPHLLKEVIDSQSGESVQNTKPEILFESNISKSVWNQVRDYLRYTVTNGSAQFPLRNKIVQIAGKTGTGEVSQYKDRWHSWFVSYAPFDAPPEDTVVVAVLVEAVNPWEWWAPYASNIILQGIFAGQTYEQAIDALGFKYLKKPMGRQE
ncbi:MAG: penicillin-binding protein 2 [Bacteroides sp.]|nr:penicillin-binding protein 2 [Prevotella sp.]MCM1407903.1 penicillin-binding protein 2 [Treponema brennaborense]MCM1469645.1 penicillin-binding protein 2 [Bacteroides sp.]